jgi:hypothetical protein
MFRQRFVYLAMARNRLLLAGGWIELDIVPAAMADKNAAGRQQQPDRIVPFQRAMSFIA